MLNEINFNNVCYLKNDAAHGCSSSLLTVSMSHSQLHIILESVSLAKYLGVDISSDLSWDTHINRISKKANNTIGFLRRNIKNHLKSIETVACSTLEQFNQVVCKIAHVSP